MDYSDKERGYLIRPMGSKVHLPSPEYRAFLQELLDEIQQDIAAINKEREKGENLESELE